MNVVLEYSLYVVDHVRFSHFVNSLNPSFKMISQGTLKTNIMKVFTSEKVILKETLVHNFS